jgi:hypothetical protein
MKTIKISYDFSLTFFHAVYRKTFQPGGGGLSKQAKQKATPQVLTLFF